MSNKPVTEAIGTIVANTYRLMFKTQAFHWNAKGPLFPSFHALTETQYTELFKAVDDLAERMLALGTEAPSSLDEIMTISEVRDRLDVPAIEEMIRELVDDNREIAVKCQDGVNKAEEANDSATADMLTARRFTHEKQAWLLEAMLDPR